MLDDKGQQLLLNLCISDNEIFTQVRTIFQPKYFAPQYQKVVSYLLDFASKYNSLPVIEQINDVARLEKPLEKVPNIDGNLNIRQSILDMAETFCKQRALELAIIDCSERINKGQRTGIDLIIKEAQKVSLNKDFGINFWENTKEWLSEQFNEQGTISTGWKALDDMLYGGFGWGELEYFIGAPNSGKCECKGTRIRMFDGSVKNIEDIIVGDKLMGIDSTPRTVKSLARGKEKLYEIEYTGIDEKGKMTVTGEHTLYFLDHNISNIFKRTEMTVKFVKKINENNDNLLRYGMIITKYLPSINQVIEYPYSSFIISIKQKDYEEDYYGFELDGDRLYIHEDGIVTHNSLICQNIGLNLSRLGHTVLYFTLEMDMKLVGRRIAGMASGIAYRSIKYNLDETANRIYCERHNKKPGVFQLINIKIGCTANDIEAYIQDFELKTNLTPDILIIDYADIMNPCDRRVDVNNKGIFDDEITKDLRALARERTANGKPTLAITASQTTKDAIVEEELNMTNIAGGKGKSTNADNIIANTTSDALREKGEFRLLMLKTRNSGGKGKKVKLKFNVDTLRIEDIDNYEESKAKIDNTSPTSVSSETAMNGLQLLRQKILENQNNQNNKTS